MTRVEGTPCSRRCPRRLSLLPPNSPDRPVEHHSAGYLRLRNRRTGAQGVDRYMDRKPDLLCLPVGGLQQLRRRMQQDLQRPLGLLHAAGSDVGSTIVVLVTAEQLARLCSGSLGADGCREHAGPPQACKHVAADDLRLGRRRPEPQSSSGDVDGKPDLLRLPVAGLQQLRLRLRLDIGRDRLRLHPPARAMSDTRCVFSVTAGNSVGSSQAASAATAVVNTPGPHAPSNTSAPTISGSTLEGQTLTAGHGTWTESPTSYGYQWERCNSGGASCKELSGAVSTTYALGSADVGVNPSRAGDRLQLDGTTRPPRPPAGS